MELYIDNTLVIGGTVVGRSFQGVYHRQENDLVHLLKNDGTVVKGFKEYPTTYRPECIFDLQNKCSELRNKHYEVDVARRTVVSKMDGPYETLAIFYKPEYGYVQWEK